MKEMQAPHHPPTPGADGVLRLLSLVDRSAPPHRPVGGLIHSWYAASGTALLFDEWADPAARHLAAVFDRDASPDTVEQAIVAFAQARAGAGHDVDEVGVDLVALVRVAWPTGRGSWGEIIDPVGLLARALGAWAIEHTAATAGRGCIDPVSGLATGQYLKERVRELHDQCGALAISPPVTFGALVVQLHLATASATDRIATRVDVGRVLSDRFRAGETLAAPGPSRQVAVMPTYGLARAVKDVRADLAALAVRDGVGVTVGRAAFAESAEATYVSLAGTRVGV
ncbi:MAG TPA: hypothetical protein VFY82_14035 [Acidimicrobiales bacterium]|nr:hypothetical protein [Acidimicrobiales bacterium]